MPAKTILDTNKGEFQTGLRANPSVMYNRSTSVRQPHQVPPYQQEETLTGSFSIVQFSAAASFFMLSFTLFGNKPAGLIKNGYNN